MGQGRELVEGVFGTVNGVDVEALLFEKDPDHGLYAGIVLDDQHRLRARISSGRHGGLLGSTSRFVSWAVDATR